MSLPISKKLKQGGKLMDVVLLCKSYKKPYTVTYDSKYAQSRTDSFFRLYCDDCHIRRWEKRKKIMMEEYKQTKEKTLTENCYFCETTENLILHHKTLTANDTIALCRSCHIKIHKLTIPKEVNDVYKD